LEIAVIGGGNGAYAAAADLADLGHRVRLWRRDRDAFQPVLDTQSLTLRDARGVREVALRLATVDLAAAVDDAELVIVPVPAFAQPELAHALAPHLAEGQIVLMPPGSFGCYVMDRELRRAGEDATLVFAESGTLPWLARKHGPREIVITARATRLPTGIYPTHHVDWAFDRLRQAFPAIEPCADALDAALLNAGPIIHPPLILMNAGPLEHLPQWDIHNEGTQPAIRRVTDALDAERIAVRTALGYGEPHFPLADHYNPDGPEWMYGRRAHDRLVDSEDWRERIDLTRHRYMREDVAIGLAFLVSVAEWAGVDAPVARGLLALGSAVVGEDLRRTGRTLETLDLQRFRRVDLQQLLRDGLAS
jgi:opine dehydrogenase